MATSTSTATTYAEMTGSPYYPKKSGRLLRVQLGLGGDATTSLMHKVVVKLECPLWGVPITIMNHGADLMTAPAHPIPISVMDCDVVVQTGSAITLQVKHETGATPVTPRINVIGVFEG